MMKIPRLSNMVVVRHAVNTTEDEPKEGGSWINYWKAHMPYQPPKFCPCCKKIFTSDNPVVGGHVNRIFEQDFVKREYIVAVCDTCNKRYKGTKASKIFFVPKAYLCYVP